MKKILALLVTSVACLAMSAQQIISVSPNTISPGASSKVLLTTSGIYLDQSSLTVDFGPGITVNSYAVTNPQLLTVDITASSSAATGTRSIYVTSGNQQTRLQYDLFDVTAMGGTIIASMTVIPVQKLYLTDFDPNNPGASPLLFMVNIINDNATHNLTVKLTISGAKYNSIVTGTKRLKGVQPMSTTVFNNKEFDSYNVITANKAAIDEATKTGKLPPDVYTYAIEVFEGNVKVAEAEGKNIVDDPVARPELISPGSDISRSPEVIFTKMPFFQWFSQAPTHDIMLYPVMAGQRTREEIALNRPVWEQRNVSTKNIIYPASAEILEDGKTYAWQVTGLTVGSKGEEKLFSDMYWFTVNLKDSRDVVYTQFSIVPEDKSMPASSQFQFVLKAMDKDYKVYDLSSKVEWRVIPSTAGTITPEGLFIAGKYPAMAAVVAKYGTQETFANITILASTASGNYGWDMGLFLRKVFGITK